MEEKPGRLKKKTPGGPPTSVAVSAPEQLESPHGIFSPGIVTPGRNLDKINMQMDSTSQPQDQSSAGDALQRTGESQDAGRATREQSPSAAKQGCGWFRFITKKV